MAKIEVKNIVKAYKGSSVIFDDLNLIFNDKEFIVILGPSGCGKSTLLRIIAGLEEFDSGEILMDGRNITNVSPKDRDIAMVFQNYALYPHKNVYGNLEFGLKMRGVNKSIREQLINEAAETLGIKELLHRRPKQLSGGQRQRVALGRAIVRQPELFLMDEPLSNLDAKLRVKMRAEIIELYQKLNQTMIYVTHDQTEAMTMGSRILLLNDGKVQQFDVPDNLYNKPKNLFVAQFIGSPQMNTFRLPIHDGKVILGKKQIQVPNNYSLPEIYLGIRSENLSVDYSETEFTIAFSENLGNERLVYLNNGRNPTITVRDYSDYRYSPGEKLGLQIDTDKLHWFDVKTEQRVN